MHETSFLEASVEHHRRPTLACTTALLSDLLLQNLGRKRFQIGARGSEFNHRGNFSGIVLGGTEADFRK